MDIEKILELVKSSEYDGEIHLHFHMYPEGEILTIETEDSQDDEDPPPVDEAPDTRVIEVVDGESFKEVDYFNAAGIPVMQTAVVGWKSQPGERYLAYVDPIQGDGGSLWWRLWKGPAEIDEATQALVRGYFLNKTKTRKI